MGGLTTILAVGATAVSAIGSLAQGRQAEATSEAQSDLLLEQAETRKKEADRVRKQAELDSSEFRRRESRLLASQRAGFAASGVSFAGTPLFVGEDSASEIALQARKVLVGGLTDADAIESEASGLTAEAAIARSKGRVKRNTAFATAGSTLLSGASRFAGEDFFGN